MEEINIVEVLQLFIRRLWILIVAFVLCAAIGFGYCEFLATKQYSANSRLVITTGGILTNENIENPDKITATDVSTSLAMLETYAVTLDMLDMYYIVLDEVGAELSTKYTASQLKNMTNYRYTDSSLIVSVSVTCADSKDATIIANSVAKQAPKYLQKFFPTTSAIVVEYSERSSLSYPNDFLIVSVAGIAGLVVAAVIICIIALTDKTIKNEQQITSLGITVIGIVPDFNTIDKTGGYYRHE